MSRPAINVGLGAAVVCFVAFVLSGVPIFQRGPWSAACFVACGVAFNLGVALYLTKKPSLEAPAQAPAAPPPPPQGVNLEAFETLKARVEIVEKKMAGLAFLNGMRSRRGPMMPTASAPESPR